MHDTGLGYTGAGTIRTACSNLRRNIEGLRLRHGLRNRRATQAINQSAIRDTRRGAFGQAERPGLEVLTAAFEEFSGQGAKKPNTLAKDLIAAIHEWIGDEPEEE